MKGFYLLTIFFFSTTTSLVSQPFLHIPIEGEYKNDFIIVNYVDWGIDGSLSDYNCGNKTYAGHQGTDFIIRNFASMDTGVFVLAAADGVVTYIQDGIFDREKESVVEKGFGNYIAIRHDNGFYTYYAHLAKHSINVQPGDTVNTGDRIALVGSSGNSSDPHLHFELWFDSLFVVDPFAGICGNLESLWLEKVDYDTTFNIWTSGLTNFIPWLDTLREEPVKQNHFLTEDDAIAYWSILYGIRKGDDLTINWYTPDQSLWFTFSYEVEEDFWYFYYWSYIDFPFIPYEGNWSARLYHNGQMADEINFTVEQPSYTQEVYSENWLIFHPNPFYSQLSVSWYSPFDQAVSLEVFNSFGKNIKNIIGLNSRLGQNKITLDGSNWEPGIYILRFTYGEIIQTNKIVLLR